MQSYFQELLNFDLSANEKFFDIIGALQDDRIPRTALRQISHLLNTHAAWNSRILNKVSMYGIWELHEPDSFREIAEENFTLTQQIIAELPLHMKVRYENKQGDFFTYHLTDILTHIFYHSTYHRAQTAFILREHSILPPETNYIFYEK